MTTFSQLKKEEAGTRAFYQNQSKFVKKEEAGTRVFHLDSLFKETDFDNLEAPGYCLYKNS